MIKRTQKLLMELKNDLDDLMNDWKVYVNERNDIINTEMKAYNDLFKTLAIPALILDGKT